MLGKMVDLVFISLLSHHLPISHALAHVVFVGSVVERLAAALREH